MSDEYAYPQEGHGMMCRGLTKREQYAMAAMQGILSNPALLDTLSFSDMGWAAGEAIHQADALISRLEEDEK